MDIDQRINEKANIILSRYDFWEFCKYYDPEFFKEERTHLKRIAEIFEKVRSGEFKKVSMSMPPRAGKSYITTLFCAFMLGLTPSGSIMRNSYSERLANKFSYDVRDIVKSDKFKKVFPVELAADKQAVTGWSLVDSKQVGYFCAGVGGSITGFGCNLLAILDDPIKNMEEALSEVVLESKWNWYTSTHKSRLEMGCPEIHIATRWSKKDIIGKLLEQDYFDYNISIKAIENGKSFCEDIKPLNELLEIKNLQAEFIWEAEYMQSPIEVKGLLFPVDELKRFTLSELKLRPDGVIGATDTADKGTDYLCSPLGKQYGLDIYIIDVVFTQDAIELTEPAIASMLIKHNADKNFVESNAGGRSFAVNLRKLLQGTKTIIEDGATTANKETRILMKSGYIKEHFWFRSDYEQGSDYDLFMRQLTSYVKAGKNKNDDAPDGVTLLAEYISNTYESWFS